MPTKFNKDTFQLAEYAELANLENLRQEVLKRCPSLDLLHIDANYLDELGTAHWQFLLSLKALTDKKKISLQINHCSKSLIAQAELLGINEHLTLEGEET